MNRHFVFEYYLSTHQFFSAKDARMYKGPTQHTYTHKHKHTHTHTHICTYTHSHLKSDGIAISVGTSEIMTLAA
jgi:hypothetical protein